MNILCKNIKKVTQSNYFQKIKSFLSKHQIVLPELSESTEKYQLIFILIKPFESDFLLLQ